MSCCNTDCENCYKPVDYSKPPYDAYSFARTLIIEHGIKKAIDKAVRNLEITYQLEQSGIPASEQNKKWIRDTILQMPLAYNDLVKKGQQ